MVVLERGFKLSGVICVFGGEKDESIGEVKLVVGVVERRCQ